ncbi:flagellin [Planctomicrobium sp. SH664]|uniref:flagellin N-terminal helical domain-containing protein n=1 Tax=Planctomicrobium sp. SH664 TaxID=3448125 RepID=UPI003F5AEE6D
MGLTIANNVSSMTAQNQLNKASVGLSRSIERLSSGFRVNRGADDPSGLVISERQRAQISGLQKAIENADKAVSLVQTAEGALSEINALLLKVRGLAIDSANAGVNDEDAQAANQAEIENALQTIDRIANNTQFGTKNLLNGSSGISGVASNSNISFLKASSNTTAGAYNINITSAATRATTDAGFDQTDPLAADEILTINGVSITLNAGLSQSEVVARINTFTASTGVSADISSGATRLYTTEFGANAKLSVISNQAGAASSSGFGTTGVNAVGTDVTGTIGGTSFTGNGNLLQATSGPAKGLVIKVGLSGSDPTSTVSGAQGNVTVTDNSLVFQIGPNTHQSTKIAIPQIYAQSLGVGVNGNRFNNLAEINVTSAAKAQDAISIIDSAITDITILRGELGSFQGNTLESTANNLRTTLENTVSAESTIRDTDFASEIANFTRQQILVQAGTSVLSSANQIPQQVLALLNKT